MQKISAMVIALSGMQYQPPPSQLSPVKKRTVSTPIMPTVSSNIWMHFFLTKFNLKTPGREDDDADETKVTLSNNNFTEVAKIVLEGVGGPENVASIDNCITRLRLEVKDYTKVNEKLIKSAGVAGVMRPSKTSVQVIIGTQVQFVADEFKKLCK